MDYQEEINRRRTFAIISHPDAGKTTLTEKLLLFGGAIHVAGAVKSNKIRRTATSDWMDIERQRGISVATSVMAFDYDGRKVTILDTPGHQDFAEDTFRTLTAVDSAVVVIDAAKGVEQQTRRLMDVCRMRRTPIIVFINKMDRPGRDAFELLDQIETELHIAVCPPPAPPVEGLSGFGDMTEMYPAFDLDAYLAADLAPTFFGSALKNLGVRELLDTLVRIAPAPRPVSALERTVTADEPTFTGFVFKIHANMDPNHRSRIAFVKVCSGRFLRNAVYRHVRLGKDLRFTAPTAFMAQRKETVDEAYAGDVIGLPDTGVFKIGDTLTEGPELHFRGLPSFSPELFKYIENADPMKSKQLAKGISQLMDEGVAQQFIHRQNGRRIIGTVGQLQFEVIQHRLLHEYGAACRWEPISLYKASWVEGPENDLATFRLRKAQYMAYDKEHRDVFLASTPYLLDAARQDFPTLRFHFTSERE
ncbi:MAG: GTP-binding protein [Tannerellaceae bacterium]|nr:GTP-binding protein [Tannerellaceae bacterium]